MTNDRDPHPASATVARQQIAKRKVTARPLFTGLVLRFGQSAPMCNLMAVAECHHHESPEACGTPTRASCHRGRRKIETMAIAGATPATRRVAARLD
jgi:hypothetical protein